MFSRRYMLLSVFLLLSSGLFIYRICRPDMLLFQWLQLDHVSASKPRGLLGILNNYYGDLVWIAGICITTIYLVAKKFATGISVLALLLLPFITEAAQGLKLMPGVFDWIDILIYVTVTLFFILLFPKHFLLWKN